MGSAVYIQDPAAELRVYRSLRGCDLKGCVFVGIFESQKLSRTFTPEASTPNLRPFSLQAIT